MGTELGAGTKAVKVGLEGEGSAGEGTSETDDKVNGEFARKLRVVSQNKSSRMGNEILKFWTFWAERTGHVLRQRRAQTV